MSFRYATSFARRSRILLSIFCTVFFLSLGLVSYSFAEAPAKETKIPTVKTPIEKEHVPVIRIPDNPPRNQPFTVSVQIGEVLHEATKDHRIEWIEGFLDKERIFRWEISPAVAEPRLSFSLKVDQYKTLKIEARCNQHGIWGTEVLIRPEEDEAPVKK
jgi:desulfoferrodoxin-like iron-binding protein